MEITIRLPDDLILRSNAEEIALQAFAIQSYRCGALSHFQISKLLDLSRFETDGFLKKHEVEEFAYGVDDLACDLMSLPATPALQQRSS